MNIIYIESTPSTNSYLKELANREEIKEGTFVVTREQTAGRGQAGNSWESEPDMNLTFSLLLYPTFLSIKDYFLLSKAVSLGVKDSLDEYVSNILIKWPNDIYFEDRKMAGILIENEIQGTKIVRSIIGIGININQEVFSDRVPNPTSLRQVTGQEFNLNSLMESFSENILSRYRSLQDKDKDNIEIDDNYYKALYRRDIYADYKDKNGIFNAKIEAVDNSGFLHLTTDSGEKRQYTFKEVSFCKEHD